MQRQHFLKKYWIAFVAVGALAMGLGLYRPAIPVFTGKGPLMFSADHEIHTEKVRGSLDVKLIASEAKAYAVGDIFTLRAAVDAGPNVQGLAYRWVLPKGVEIVSGEGAGDVASSAAGPVYIDIVLRKLNDGNDRIHFVVSGKEGAAKIGQSVQFHTRDQQLVHDENERMLKQSLETNPDDGEGQEKVYQ